MFVGQCSVTCGEGYQTREVVCVGANSEPLGDHACSGLVKPASVQTCRRPACYTQITWHVTSYGLVSESTRQRKKQPLFLLHAHPSHVRPPVLSPQCTRSCGGGVRERRVGCFDTDLNPHPENQCGVAGRPTSVETCNPQPCHRAQRKPSLNKHPSTLIFAFFACV